MDREALQSAVVPDWSRGFHQALRWSIYEAGCCSRTGSLPNSGTENSSLLIPSTFHAFRLIIFPHIHSEVSTWTEFAVKAVASVVLFSSRQKMWPCENGAQCLEVMTCCTTLLVICAPCGGRRGGLGYWRTDAYYSLTTWRQIDSSVVYSRFNTYILWSCSPAQGVFLLKGRFQITGCRR